MVVVTRLPPIELWCTAPASGTPRSVSLTKAPMTQATLPLPEYAPNNPRKKDACQNETSHMGWEN